MAKPSQAKSTVINELVFIYRINGNRIFVSGDSNFHFYLSYVLMQVFHLQRNIVNI